MIEAVAGVAGSTIPDDPAVRNVEGRILGLRLSPERATVKPVRTGAAKQPANHQSVPDRGTADRSEIGNHSRWCPACSRKLFTRWPWGWDGHAAHACTVSWAPRQTIGSGSTENATSGKSSRATSRRAPKQEQEA
jgi:hypothetical protein